MAATHPYIPRIGVVMDFDKTLASDTIEALCAAWGITRREWEAQFSEPLGNGWDGILRRSLALIHCGRAQDEPLSLAFFERAAGQIELYEGVTDLPGRLREAARDVHEEASVECVVLSSGYAEMIKHTAIAEAFDLVWAGTCHFDAHGTAIAVKRIISHGQKARYLAAYAKGLDVDAANEPRTDAKGFDEFDMHVPFDQLIYVGDGLSDLKAFQFVTNHGGIAIAIDKDHQFDHEDEQLHNQRVDNLCPADYQPGSELVQSLEFAVKSAAARMAIRALSRGE